MKFFELLKKKIHTTQSSLRFMLFIDEDIFSLYLLAKYFLIFVETKMSVVYLETGLSLVDQIEIVPSYIFTCVVK